MSAGLDATLCNAEAARLLPWFVTGLLADADTARVAQHLEHCPICRADLAEQRVIRATLKDGGPIEYAPQAGLARTLARIDAATLPRGSGRSAPDPVREPRRTRRRMGALQWLTAAAVVQAIGLAAIGGSVLLRPGSSSQAARYETLASPEPRASGPRIRVVFAESMSVGDLKTLLAAEHLLIVSGPSEAGVFTLGVSEAAPAPERVQGSLAHLRVDPHVLFAEPVGTDRPRSR